MARKKSLHSPRTRNGALKISTPYLRRSAPSSTRSHSFIFRSAMRRRSCWYSGREAFVLARVGADPDPSIRLACQLRPQTDVAVIPVLPTNIGADFVRNRRRLNIGEERYVVSMFVDMRGSTKLSGARLPFDTV